MFIQKATRGLYQRISASPLARIPLYTAATRNIGGTPHGLSDEEIANRNEMIPIVRLFLLLLLLVCCCSTTTTLLLLLYSSRISMFPEIHLAPIYLFSALSTVSSFASTS
jgi:hypothetical protein